MIRIALAIFAFASCSFAATFGSVVPLVGGASDLVLLDEARRRLYLANTSQSRIEVYSIAPAIAPGSLISIFGRNLADSEVFTSTPLPTTLGGACVILNNQPLPLLMTSPGQINAQIPPEIAAGRHSLVVRALDKKAASTIQSITVAQSITAAKYAPAVFTDIPSKMAAVYHRNGRPATRDEPAKRDEPLVLYATGLGPTTGGRVTSGAPSPSNPLAVTGKVDLFFGDPRIKEAGIIVDRSGLSPGLIGVYQVNIRVPGDHLRGDALPVILRIGGSIAKRPVQSFPSLPSTRGISDCIYGRFVV